MLKAVFAAALALCAGAAHAQDRACIQIKLIAESLQKTADARGRKAVHLLPVSKIDPGEMVMYTVSATNICKRAMENVVIDQPVPAHMTYVEGSAVGPGTAVVFSVDGGFNYGTAQMLQAKPEQYTDIRWIMSKPLKPGAVALARFRALFNR